VSVALQNAASDQGIFEVGWTHVRRSLMAHLMGNHLWWFLRPLRASRVSDNGAYTVPYIVKLIPTVSYLSIIERHLFNRSRGSVARSRAAIGR
jgi:hypothetical protein